MLQAGAQRAGLEASAAGEEPGFSFEGLQPERMGCPPPAPSGGSLMGASREQRGPRGRHCGVVTAPASPPGELGAVPPGCLWTPGTTGGSPGALLGTDGGDGHPWGQQGHLCPSLGHAAPQLSAHKSWLSVPAPQGLPGVRELLKTLQQPQATQGCWGLWGQPGITRTEAPGEKGEPAPEPGQGGQPPAPA